MVNWQIRAISFFWQTFVISRSMVHYHPFHFSELNLIKLRRGDEFKVKTTLLCHCLMIRWALVCKWDTISIMLSRNLSWILFFTVDKETKSFFYDIRGIVILHLNVQNDQLVFCKHFEARHAFTCNWLIS